MNPISIIKRAYTLYKIAQAALPAIKVAGTVGVTGAGIGTGIALHKTIEKRFKNKNKKEDLRDKVLKERKK